jgi:hypothetical protein
MRAIGRVRSSQAQGGNHSSNQEAVLNDFFWRGAVIQAK